MDRTIEFLQKNRESFELYAHFDDHKIYYDLIEGKLTSDSCIETCKSLIEGICKTILLQVDIRDAAVRDRFSENELIGLDSTYQKMKGKGEDFHALYGRAVIVLAAYHHSCEKDLLDKLGKEFCKYIGKVRNDGGPIAHGQPSPKPYKSSKTLAVMIEGVTDIIAFHMLEVLSLIDFRQAEGQTQDQAILESFMLKTEQDLESISEGERLIREFNDSIDELYPWEGKPRYSRALYEQYPEDYNIQLQDFIDNKEQESGE